MLVLTGIALLSAGINVLAHYHAVQPDGSDGLLLLSQFTAIPFLGSVVAAPMLAVGLLVKRWRRAAAAGIVALLLVAASIYLSLSIGLRIRHSALAALADRSKSLVESIKAYESRHGRPPDSLSALIPEFLSAVPETGMGAYREYRYLIPKNSSYSGNPWILVVDTPVGIPDFDQFVYFPLQNYPPKLDGNPME